VPYDFIPEFDLLICIDYFAADRAKLSREIDVANQRFCLPMLPATGRIPMAASETVWRRY
jgi:hypothetical protein